MVVDAQASLSCGSFWRVLWVRLSAMSRRQKLENRLERALLTWMMLSIALVMEKLLERMVEGQQGRPRSQWGQRLFRRLMPSAHLRHDHPHQPQSPA